MCSICGDDKHVPPLSRRAFLTAGAAVALASSGVGTALAADPPKPGAAPPPNAIPPAAALKRLLDGNARYVANAPRERDYSAGRAARSTTRGSRLSRPTPTWP